jgi:hypothetical protein
MKVESYLVTYDNYSDEQIKDIKQIFSRFKSELKKRWTLAHKKKETFITKNNVWLAGTLAIPRVANRPGRPQKQFSDASDRSKRRETEDVRNSMDVELLIHAYIAEMTIFWEKRRFSSVKSNY